MSLNKPTIPEVLPLIHRLYSGEDSCSRYSGCVGGHLHIVLADTNVEDHMVRYCLEEALKDECETCIKLARLLLQMSQTQRVKLSARAYE